MAITSSPSDKYALLFTGPTTERFLKDIENVSQVLIEFYNYPASQVWVVLGSPPTVMPGFSGATVKSIASAADFSTEMANFAAVAAGSDHTILVYCTGGGVESADGSDASELIINDAAIPDTIAASWMTTRLNALDPSHVNVVMQQPFAGGFQSAFSELTLAEWSFTYACGAHEQSYGDFPVVKGSYFTYDWTQALQLQALPPLAPDAGKYADELGGGPEHDNRLVSMQEAMAFAKQLHDYVDAMAAFSTPGYSGMIAGGPQYLGIPELIIRDGATPVPWYESPDIILTHPNHPWVDGLPSSQDLYIPDAVAATPPYNNTLNITVRNIGSHPVRTYSLGIELFKSGGGGASSAQYTGADAVPAGGILLPIDPSDIGGVDDQFDTYVWNAKFEATATHRCVKAEAKPISATVDFAWSVVANDFEGQRNIDVMSIIPSPPPMPSPLPFKEIMGYKEHIYGFKNSFDSPKQFMVAFPPEYQKYQEVVALAWFHLPQGPNSERIPLKINYEPVPHLDFTLKPGEERDVLLHVDMKPEFNVPDGITLPFEVLIETDEPTENIRRTAALAETLPRYAAIAGFTVVIKKQGGTVKGVVTDANHRPAKKAKVFLQTVNGLQGGTVVTDGDGRFDLTGINADVYHVRAETADLVTPKQTIVVTPEREVKLDLVLKDPVSPQEGRPIKIILDKIRILNDSDPCIKGAGELQFTSVVVPDNDPGRRQVTKLPAKGVYHVSDQAGKNDIEIKAILFDGLVKHESLSLTISGKEIDLFDPDDTLQRYHRVFSGDPKQWYGEYRPGDEYLDGEDVGEWALWYRIVEK